MFHYNALALIHFQKSSVRRSRTMDLGVEMNPRQEGQKLREEETAQTDSGMASEEEEEEVQPEEEEREPVEVQVVWGNVAKFVVLHSLALYSVVLLPDLCLASWAFLVTTYIFSGLHLVLLLTLTLLLLLLCSLSCSFSCSFSCPFSFSFSCSFLLPPGWGITAGAHRLWAHRSYKVGNDTYSCKP